MVHVRLPFAGAAVVAILTPASLAFADPCYVDSENGNDSADGLTEQTPVASQAAIPSSCTEVYYARGSVFNEAVDTGGFNGTRTVFAAYGDASLPKPAFIVPHTYGSGPLFSTFNGGVTVDSLYLEGSKGDGTMAGLNDGVCMSMMGGNNQVLNCEITNCDIGMMLHGEGSLIQGNYFHDMTMAVDAEQGSVDPNVVGGGNGIFIHGSNNEIAYNSFVRCADYAEWTSSPCDGGATEITVGSGATITGVKVHHNFSLESCGFLEIASMAGETGNFVDSEFHHNVHVDGGWLMLLQVNNTEMSNVSFTNNTVIQRPDSYNTGMVVTVFDGYSSGTEGGTLDPGEVSMTNNLIIFDGVTSYGDVIDPAITQATNLILNTSSDSPGLFNLAGTAAADFDLVEGSPAIDVGTATSYTTDFLDRAAPANGTMDVGAFEFQPEGSGGAPGSGGTGAGVGGDPGSGGAETGTGGDPGSGGATTGSGGAETGSGGAETGSGGAETGSGGAETGSGGAPGSGGATTGSGGATTGSGGATTGAGGDPGLTGSGGATAPCNAGLTLCGGLCVDIVSDAANCGDCGVVCPTGQYCSVGTCTTACPDGLTQCGQSCADVMTSVLHCGRCDAPCDGGQLCQNGVCTGTSTGTDVTQPVAPRANTEAESESGSPDEDSGCGCVTAGSSQRGIPIWSGLMALLASVLLRRRWRI
jgi:hypothetical protein